jgi:hypothetical protein
MHKIPDKKNPSQPKKNVIGCIVNVQKMPIQRFELLDDRAGFKSARARQLILHHVAGKANPDGTHSFVSDDYLAKRTGFTPRHCRRLRCDLKILALLDWNEKIKFQGSNLYTVTAEPWPRRRAIRRIFEAANPDISTDANADISKPNPDISASNADIAMSYQCAHPDVPLPPYTVESNIPPSITGNASEILDALLGPITAELQTATPKKTETLCAICQRTPSWHSLPKDIRRREDRHDNGHTHHPMTDQQMRQHVEYIERQTFLKRHPHPER